ncbi:hypothetical protein MIB92_13400 [Aestuariirhabdus sp. Z084]|uniref:hypothetical protein n=1 Tax=Aestuariirhabdus haliotis TaxID=2918751 RepID=UPI00201B3A6B|nr:hypothetical protein [Aestuariirhabdus haliotis]MCL6416650.1 hypothetical protein [Aestuariirhabdus haliotis]MCL6420685.1 hypothetical protein [Aestuariirhabdus haliotis]
MGNFKGPTEGGSGGKRGHSNMEHWTETEKLKGSSRIHRRRDDLHYSREGIDEYTRKYLQPYWFPLDQGIGIGITAYSEGEAISLAEECLKKYYPNQELGKPIIGLSVNELDQGHVIPNMGPINLKGVWFPKENV